MGLDACETPIEQSVCAHALQQKETLIIPDLTKDERTRGNPLVTGEPFIRFYAGVALLADSSGVAIGTLCVIDTLARPGGLPRPCNKRRASKRWRGRSWCTSISAGC